MLSNSGSISYFTIFAPVKGNNNILFHYEGVLEHKTIDIILQQAIKAMEVSGIEKCLQKKSFRIMMESLENIQKHSGKIVGGHSCSSFIIIKNPNELIFKTSNPIFNTEKKEIQERIEEINQSSFQTLKKMQENKLTTGELTPKGGSGIGLINIALRSNNKLDYKFEPIDKETSQFILKIKVNI